MTVGGDTLPTGDFSLGHDELPSSHFTGLSAPSHHQPVVYVVFIRFDQILPLVP